MLFMLRILTQYRRICNGSILPFISIDAEKAKKFCENIIKKMG